MTPSPYSDNQNSTWLSHCHKNLNIKSEMLLMNWWREATIQRASNVTINSHEICWQTPNSSLR